jgi:predicted metal-dependent hydrolase
MNMEKGSGEVLPNPDAVDCQGAIHPKAVEGLDLFNRGQYWKAHEALEAAWLAEGGEIRHLYRGILQVGVAYLHIQRCNYRGAMKMYYRSQRWLDPFPDVCRGINVGKVKQDFEIAIAQVQRLGPDRMAEFDPNLLKPVSIHFDDA